MSLPLPGEPPLPEKDAGEPASVILPKTAPRALARSLTDGGGEDPALLEVVTLGVVGSSTTRARLVIAMARCSCLPLIFIQPGAVPTSARAVMHLELWNPPSVTFGVGGGDTPSSGAELSLADRGDLAATWSPLRIGPLEGAAPMQNLAAGPWSVVAASVGLLVSFMIGVSLFSEWSEGA